MANATSAVCYLNVRCCVRLSLLYPFPLAVVVVHMQGLCTLVLVAPCLACVSSCYGVQSLY